MRWLTRNHCARRSLTTLLMTCLIVTVFALPVRAADSGSCGSKLNWSLSGGTLTITGSGDMTDFWDNYFAPWYDQADQIVAVSLPSGLTRIGNLAFYGCENLRSISIPSSVTSIGSYAFAECSSLLTVSLPSGLTSIGENAFRECESLASIRFPDSVTSLGSQAFYRCYSLQAVTVPSSVTTMGGSVFAYCTGLVRAVVNAPLTTLPQWTFYGCTSLSDVSLATATTSTGEYAFQGCSSLSTVYTQTNDIDTAYQIQQSMAQNHDDLTTDGLVASYDQPDSSTTVQDDGKKQTETEVRQTDNAVIAIKHTTDSTGENTGTSTTISATIDSDEGWSELEDAVSEELDKGLSDSVDVQIQLSGGEVNGDDLSRFAGKDLTLDLTTDSGVVWKIDMSNVSKDDISGKYDLGVTTTLIDPTEKKLDLDSESVYQVSFSGSTDFNASVGIRLADGAAYQKATLYQMIDGKLEAVQSVVVDADGVAWFNLAQTDKKTDYYIGVNPAELEAEDAVIPESLYQNYGMSDVSYLTDDNGISYEITGRTSSWGISGGQFALYAALAIGLMILIVSIVMITMNKMKQSRERWFGES